LPTDERIKNYNGKNDPNLAALVFQFGRYLLVCSSRPGTQPANLQGIWNESMNPAWDAKYTTNINLEMNYWPAELTNLSECAEPLLKMIKELTDQGSEVAKEHFMKGSVEFFLDFLEPHPKHGWPVTNPSTSPENFPDRPGNITFFDETTGWMSPGTTLCAGSTIDLQILGDLFSYVGEASKILGIDEEFRKKVLETNLKLRLAADQE